MTASARPGSPPNARRNGRRPIRVLQLVNAFGGGPGVVVYNLAKNLDPDRFHTTVCRLVSWNRPQEEAIHQSILDLGIESINLEIDERFLHGALDVGVLIKLRRLLNEREIDIIHTHLIRADFFGRLAAWTAGVHGIVATVHNVERYHVSARPVARLARAFERFSVRGVGKVVCVSDAVRQAIMQREKLLAAKVVTILNGVDLEHYQANGLPRESVRRQMGIPPGRLVIGTVGRFYPQKGIPYLIQAGLGVVRERPDTVFLMVGEGPTRPDMWRKIEALGLSGHFVLAGPRLDVREMLSVMDMFVMPSLWEGLPIAVLEAMAMGLPCVVTNVGGNPEVVRNGVTGWVVAPRDPGELQDRVLQLVDDDGLRRSMGEAGRRLVEREFDARQTASRYAELYEEVMGTEPVGERIGVAGRTA